MKLNITEEMEMIIRGTFSEHPFDPDFDIGDEILECTLESSNTALELVVEYCNMLLGAELSAARRQQIWVNTVGDTWDLTPQSVLNILNFLRDESIKELEARKSGEKPEPKF